MIVLLSLKNAHAEFDLDSNFSLTPSFRYDDLKWNSEAEVNANGYDMDWRNVSILQLQLGTEVMLNELLYAKSTASFGTITSGDNQLSEFDESAIVSRSVNDAGDGEVYDISVGIGAMFRFLDHNVGNTLLLIPQIGFSVHKQNLHMKNGSQTIPANGPLAGLNSTFESQWDGPWVGIDLRFEARPSSALQVRFEYHIADYFAETNLNLDNTLAHPVSLSHDADASGSIFALGWREEFNNRWVVGFEFVTQRWTTDSGTNLVFSANGGAQETELNKVDWSSTSFGLIVSRFFQSR